MTPQEFQKALNRMKGQLKRVKDDGYRVVYIDETHFTRRTVAALEWSLPKDNVAIDQSKVSEPSLNVLLGISKEKGIEHFTVLEESWNIARFKTWL